MPTLPDLLKVRELFARHVRQRTPAAWIISLCLVPAGMLLGEACADWPIWVVARNSTYKILQDLSPHPPTHSKRTVMVVIGDEEYWRGELARRRPLKRDYLARLLRRLDSANPAAIGLDVDLRAQTPDGAILTHPDYAMETKEFLETIRMVSARRCLVLARTLEQGAHDLTAQPAIYDSLISKSFRVGYASLPYDIRRVPLVLKLETGQELDSFAAALARCIDNRAVVNAQVAAEDALPFGTFIGAPDFPQYSSRYILDADLDELTTKLAHQVVIVGGQWHEEMLARGEVTDLRLTPAGKVGGFFVHGNYVEAILFDRTYAPAGVVVLMTLEVLASLLVVVALALKRNILVRLVLVLLIGLLLMGISVVSFQNFGVFLDVFMPALLLVGHTITEHVLDWRSDAIRLKKLEEAPCT